MIAVLGPGGVGGLVAGALIRAGEDVVVVAREDTATTLEEGGLHVSSRVLGDFAVAVRATPLLTEAPDVLVLATKAVTLPEALVRVPVSPGLVVPLLNGVDHVAALRERWPRTTASVIRVESDRPETGRIVQTSPFLRVDLAPAWPEVEAFARALEAAGIPTRVSDGEADVLWTKLVRLNALALTTSAFRLPLGTIRDTPELADELRLAVEEGAAVARAEGADVAASAVRVELREAHRELTSSMSRDLDAGRPPELDAIAGAVLRGGERHGIATPTVARLSAQVRERGDGVHPPA